MKLIFKIRIMSITLCCILIATSLSSAMSNFSYSDEITNLEENEKNIINLESKDSDNNVLTICYTFQEPVVKEVNIATEIYGEVEMPGVSSFGRPGQPKLPAQSVRILLPEKTKVDEIAIFEGTQVSLGSNFRVIPGIEPVPISQFESVSIPIPDNEIYCSAEPFPGRLFTEVSTQCFRGYSIVILQLHPVQYIPNNGELFYYSDLTVSVKTVEADVKTSFRGFEDDRIQVMQKVDNHEIVDTYGQMDLSYSSKKRSDLLIITNESFKSSFKRLADFHNARGIRTAIKILGVDIPVGSDYNQTCDTIRDYIRNAYMRWGIEYVLIGGDIDIIPARYLYGDIPSDLYYSCLDGSFDANGNGRLGESGDDADLMAEVYIGRACVGNTTEIDRFVDKTLKYFNRNPDDDFLKNALMVGENLFPSWGGDYMDELIDGHPAFGTVGIPSDEYNISTLYDRDWEPNHNWPVTEIISHINNGTHIINHLGHSGPFYNMKINVREGHLDLLTNDDHCFIYSQGCDAGAFDKNASNSQENPIEDCIAEHFTIKSDYGAFAGVWNTRSGWIGPSQWFHREFWDAVFGENISVISVANQDSKEDNIYRIDENCMRYCYYEITLFGDPTLTFHNRPFHANANGPYFALVNKPIQFRGSAYSGNGPYSWFWNFGDGNTSKEKNPRHTYTSDSIYSVSLKVIDCDGHADINYTTATVYIDVDISCPSEALINESIQFNGSATGGYPPYTWSWDFDDGNFSESQNCTHTYERVGEYNVTLTVTDSKDNGGNNTHLVKISSPYVYVYANAPEGGDGSFERPYRYIQEGVNAVAENGTVYVYNGTYNENVLINKTLKLIGENSQNTFIDGDGVTGVVCVLADNVCISNFTIMDGSEGICAQSCINISISGNCFTNNYLGNGIQLVNCSKTNIFNNIITNYSNGIHFERSSNNTVNDNTIAHNNQGGILLEGSSYNIISANNVTDDSNGISINLFRTAQSGSSNYNKIIGNNVAGCQFDGIKIIGSQTNPAHDNIIKNNICSLNSYNDITFQCSRRNIIEGNECLSNGWYSISIYDSIKNILNENKMEKGLFIEGDEETFTSQEISSSNTVQGKPLYYYKNCIMNNESVPSDAGEVITGNVSYLKVEDLQINNVGVCLIIGYSDHIYVVNNSCSCSGTYGLYLLYSDNSTLFGNNVYGCGVSIAHSNYNIISCNTVLGVSESIGLYSSSNNIISENSIEGSWSGILLGGSSENSICENNISNNHNGIFLAGSINNVIRGNRIVNNSASGISLLFSYFAYSSSFNNTIDGNEIEGNQNGIYVRDSFNNCIINNTIKNNGCGVNITESYIEPADNNIIYHNNFLNNTLQANDEYSNLWNDTYPSGGNYWSDFDEPDEGAWDNDSNGIVDDPYHIPGGNNTDLFPLMYPWDPVSSLDMVYVNDDFNESTPGWNITHFNNVQDGVNAVIENGTVFVYNGTYYENVEIEKTINLIGECKNHTIIDGGAGGCDTIHVTADQTTISGFSIYKNNIFCSGIGLLSSNNVIIDNTIENIGYGILMEGYLGEILNNTIKDNNFLLTGICIFGQELSKWNSHTIENNSANGKTIYYYKNEDSVIVPSDAGQVILANCSNFLLQDITLSELYRSIQIAFCSNVTVTRNIITNNTHNMNFGSTVGIYLYDSTDIIISDNFIADIYFGIYIEESSDNQILNNTFERNHLGIYSYMSHHNTISDNNFLDTINDAIVLSSSTDNIISRNYITNNQKGISFIYNSQNNVIIENTIKYNNDGIHLSVCVNNIIQGNTISDNGNGVYLRSFSDENTIFGNTIKDNINGLIFNGSSLNTIKENHIINNQEYGIKLLIEDVYWEQHWSLNNLIYHNNLINNTQHAYDECYNMWDNDYPSGGNYWDDYTGEDENEDGIGDVPYNISGGSNQDCYPLMNPFGLIYEIDPDLSSVEQTSNFWTDFRIKNLFLTKICS